MYFFFWLSELNKFVIVEADQKSAKRARVFAGTNTAHSTAACVTLANVSHQADLCGY